LKTVTVFFDEQLKNAETLNGENESESTAATLGGFAKAS
jgi:hypothetical protein